MNALKISYSEQHGSPEDAWFWIYKNQKNFDSPIGSRIQAILHDLQGRGYFTVTHIQTIRKYAKLGRAPFDNGKERVALQQWDDVMNALDAPYIRDKIIKYLMLIK